MIQAEIPPLGLKTWDLWLGKAATLGCGGREAHGGSGDVGDACWGSPPWELPFPVSSRHFPPSTALAQGFLPGCYGVMWWDLPCCRVRCSGCFHPNKSKAGPEASSRFCDNPDGNLQGKGALSVCLQHDRGVWQILGDAGIWQSR